MLTYADVCMRQPDCDACQPHACKEVLWKGATCIAMLMLMHAYVCMRQHTSAYADECIRQHASYTAMLMLMHAYVCMRQHSSAYTDECIRQHASYMPRGVCIAKALDILLRVC
jgi:hypothetical protein